ncbi:MAG: ABC transporter permease [Chloroflexi bacterium]|nr:ABC transporter permease [Chloroflexota bacterium]
MLRYTLRRTLWAIPVLFVISLITFLLMHSIPGGPFDRQKRLPPEIMANLAQKYHLDDPLWKQYVDYMSGVLFRFDFGPSYSSTSRTVNDIFRDHLPISAQLGALALAITVAFGVPLGVIAALRHNSWADYSSMLLAVTFVSVPSLALGPFLIWLFALQLRVLPPATWRGPEYIVLPALTLAAAHVALIARLTRASMLQIVGEDYIRTARAKGLAETLVMTRHALRNALIPVTTVLGPLFAGLVTGTLVVETIFAIPGIGKYFVTSISDRDYPVVMGTVLLYAIAIILANLAVDVAYVLLDPRIRYQ